MSADPPLIAVMGPTGSGKSELALHLAEQFGGEIVNYDSVQLYRHLDIGSAKTPADERRGIPHHLLDVLEPDEHFSAGEYARAAKAILKDIAHRKRVPVLVGGTGFYLRALLHGLPEAPPRDIALRARLAARRPGSLARILRRLDPAAAARIHPNDTSKLMRAIEIVLLTRLPVPNIAKDPVSRELHDFRVYKVGLNPSREQLAERINRRCLQMFERGLIEEVQRLLTMGYGSCAKALTSIGYREAVLFIEGQLSLDAALVQTQTATRQYAKRQRTWLRREVDVHWLSGFGDDAEVQTQAVRHLQNVRDDSSAHT